MMVHLLEHKRIACAGSSKVSAGLSSQIEPSHSRIVWRLHSASILVLYSVSSGRPHLCFRGIVPTFIIAKDGGYFVGNLGLFRVTPNASKILTLS